MHTRKYDRRPTDIPITLVMDNMLGQHLHYLKNAGEGGVCFKARGCIRPGTHLKISMPFSDEPNQRPGKIAWCQREESGQYLLGVSLEQCVNRTTLHKIDRIEYFKQSQEKMGIKMTGEEAARKMGALV